MACSDDVTNWYIAGCVTFLFIVKTGKREHSKYACCILHVIGSNCKVSPALKPLERRGRSGKTTKKYQANKCGRVAVGEE